MSYIVDLVFPTAIYKNNIGTLSKEQYDFVVGQEYSKRITGTYGRDDTRVLENELFKNLKDKILTEVNFFAKDIYKYVDIEFYITHSWLNHNPKNSYHNAHRHSNSVFSGAYYINVPENCPGLYFHSSNSRMFEMKVSEGNLVNANSWGMPVSSGDLIIFPSTLTHEVPENYGDNDRYTLAFNTFIRGSIGSEGADNYVILS
jgi:uncharacterized protein (TIGR02466 family)